MVSKKEEHDAMEKLSEKDLWCKDLDDFANEWEVQLKEEADYQKTIRNTNRRASKKIGAGGKGGRGRLAKNDDDYNPKALKANPSKGVVKVEQKSHQSFLNMFTKKPKPKTNSFGSDGVEEDEVSGMSDDAFDALKAVSKPAAKQPSRAPSEQPANGRAKRAAAAAPKAWIDENDDESESDGDGFLGDVGDMVKGIGGADTKAASRLSTFNMEGARPGSSHGRSTSSDLPKLKSKPSRVFDMSDADETNYEMLAKSSPKKAPPPKDNLVDSFLSDDDIVPMVKKAPLKASAPKAKAVSTIIPDDDEEDDIAPITKKIAKPAPKATSNHFELSDDEDDLVPITKKPAAKPAAKPKKAPAAKKVATKPKAVTLSPAAKAYAAKKKTVISDDEDEDLDMDDASPSPEPAPKPAARGRGRPARAAVTAPKKKPVYNFDEDEDEDEEMDVDQDESVLVEEESEDFDDSD
jgi:DNA topoisomerase-2